MTADDVLRTGSFVRGEGGGPLAAFAVEGEVLRRAPERVWLRGLPALAVADFTWTGIDRPGSVAHGPKTR